MDMGDAQDKRPKTIDRSLIAVQEEAQQNNQEENQVELQDKEQEEIPEEEGEGGKEYPEYKTCSYQIHQKFFKLQNQAWEFSCKLKQNSSSPLPYKYCSKCNHEECNDDANLVEHHTAYTCKHIDHPTLIEIQNQTSRATPSMQMIIAMKTTNLSEKERREIISCPDFGATISIINEDVGHFQGLIIIGIRSKHESERGLTPTC